MALRNIEKEEGNLLERVEAITPKVEQQLEAYNETHELVVEATRLLDLFNEPTQVTMRELQSSGIDDARLLAAIYLLHKKRQELN